MAKALNNEVRIFFSWQSDLLKDTTTNAIRRAIRLASDEIESEFPEIKILLEEATSNMPGSPDIPTTIFEKISLSDIFISDITTIDASSSRKTANPNVLIELGFSFSQIGWERIIMLFNTKYGSFPEDVCFDIDRKRIGKFCVESKHDQVGKTQLKTLLTEAIKAIVKANPKKPHEKRKLRPEERKRELDIANLKRVLSVISIPMLDIHIQSAPDNINIKILHFFEGFRGVLRSSHFFLYDNEAMKLIRELYKLWNASLSSDVYHETGDPNVQKFGHGNKMPLTKRDKDEYVTLQLAVRKLQKVFKKFLLFIRTNYLELDIDELSRKADEEYITYYKDL